MSLRDRWRELQASYRREFDERAQQQQFRAIRDASIALAVALLLAPLLFNLALPAQERAAAFFALPAIALAGAGVVFFVSAGIRRAFTRLRALLFAGTYLVGALAAASRTGNSRGRDRDRTRRHVGDYLHCRPHRLGGLA